MQSIEGVFEYHIEPEKIFQFIMKIKHLRTDLLAPFLALQTSIPAFRVHPSRARHSTDSRRKETRTF